MSTLVGDLLSFTKGTVRKPDIVALHLADLVSRVIARECAAGADVTSAIPDEAQVMADTEYLQRAFSNLVRNALRYVVDAGPIQIHAQTQTGKAHLVVEDGGPGLPDGDLDAIFDPFYRPDAARTLGTSGAGLDLAIVKNCIEACGGTVFCRKRKPTGLKVTLTLTS